MALARWQKIISIHAPHARSDACRQPFRDTIAHFNPRSSCEERPPGRDSEGSRHLISIHAPHARSDAEIRGSLPVMRISIHAPHARSDIMLLALSAKALVFQSTLLMRGATRYCSDTCKRKVFQSTLLMRGATDTIESTMPVLIFQSTLLMRGATVDWDREYKDVEIFQSTLLMRGATILSALAGAVR